MVVDKDHQRISLPLAKPQQSNLVHLASEISANQVNQMLKRKEVERAFIGVIRLVKEESKGIDVPKEVHDYAEANVGSSTSIINPCGP